MNRRNLDIERRGRQLSKGRRGKGPVVYWMSRDQRIVDNWALLWAQQEAIIYKKGLLVVFFLPENLAYSNSRQYRFMLSGLNRLKENISRFNISFRIFNANPVEILPDFLNLIDAHGLVCDFDPLNMRKKNIDTLVKELTIPFHEVDTHNIIPVWITSGKKEYAAYTIRPKINRLLESYLTDVPELQIHDFACVISTGPDKGSHLGKRVLEKTDNIVSELPAGEVEGILAAERVINSKLHNYPNDRNNPCVDGQSGLSPYLHLGHLSPQRLAFMVSRSALPEATKETFLEELIVRRELSDNYCFYESSYDTCDGFPEWALKTLEAHRKDTRDFVYCLDELEEGKTHENLWNACQRDLVMSGKLHGYLRMYWAKKILEWTKDAETALKYAITINDRYSIDGHDPNGYAGIAWSIGGVHDRAWPERSIYGKIRYMNEAGCRRKFDVDGYIYSVKSRKEAAK